MIKNTKDNKTSDSLRIKRPDRLTSYFKKETFTLLAVTLSGLIYNIGLTAGPYFEGQLAKKLYEIMNKSSKLSAMLSLALVYVAVILVVQASRCIKRFYVRRFANNTSRNMRHMLYNNLVHKSKLQLECESVGSLMTKAVSDVDACVEGMRKFTTEVFDTGIALVAYLCMMIYYDWRIALMSSAFTPIAYIIAEKMKTVVYRNNSAYKKSAGCLNDATMERISGAVTYRVFGRECRQDSEYEKCLKQYEKAAVKANIWENTLQPVYSIISMTGVIFILYFGAKNVLGTGFCTWDIAAFTTFVSCFAKMAIKSSKAAKLFNSVQKAHVSWERIKPVMHEYEDIDTKSDMELDSAVKLEVKDISVAYDGDNFVFKGVSFKANPGDIIGITGPVASGKSSLGRAFLCERAYTGSIKINEKELSEFTDYERNRTVSYLGQQTELLSDTLKANVDFGDEKDTLPYIKAVCLDAEALQMTHGINTAIGSSGSRLSGGQKQRLALARTLYHARKIIILDDPFSAVDIETEKQIMANIKELVQDSIVLIISHRITLFSEFSKIIFMENGTAVTGTHDEMLKNVPHYADIFREQNGGGDCDEKQ